MNLVIKTRTTASIDIPFGPRNAVAETETAEARPAIAFENSAAAIVQAVLNGDDDFIAQVRDNLPGSIDPESINVSASRGNFVVDFEQTYEG
jgi:hypothetical protein